MLSAPTRMAPAASIRSTKVASCVAAGRSRLIVDPARVGTPATSNRFLTANGARGGDLIGLRLPARVALARLFGRARAPPFGLPLARDLPGFFVITRLACLSDSLLEAGMRDRRQELTGIVRFGREQNLLGRPL